MGHSSCDVAVIGAGAAGIAAGRALAAAGADYVLLEASSRLGGRALTDCSLGYPVDLGCTWLHSADQNVLADAPRAAFATESLPSHLFLDDQRRWATAEERAECYRYLDEREAAIIAAGEAGDDPPISDFLSEPSPWRRHFEWWCGAYTSASPAEVGALDWTRYRDTRQNWTVPTGYGQWIVKRARDLAIRRQTPALAIDHSGPGVRILTPAGTLAARAVILTASTAALKRIRFRPALPLAKQEALDRLPLGRVNKVALRFDRLDPDWWSGRSGVLSVRMGRHGHPIGEVFTDATTARALEAGGEAAHIDFAISQFEAMYGSSIRARIKGGRASTWGTTPRVWGAYSAMRPGGGDPRATLAEPVAGRLFFAGEATHPYFYTTAHGAWESGERAARQAFAPPG
jgi:monoamine oxidase